jgi:hypothetical protein
MNCSFRSYGTKARKLQMADLVSEDLKEREEVLVSENMMAQAGRNS